MIAIWIMITDCGKAKDSWKIWKFGHVHVFGKVMKLEIM